MAVRCKFTVQSVKPISEGSEHHDVTMTALYCPDIPEDQAFSKATPWGTLTFGCNNPRALEQLEVGKSYYLDITRVPEVDAA